MPSVGEISELHERGHLDEAYAACQLALTNDAARDQVRLRCLLCRILISRGELLAAASTATQAAELASSPRADSATADPIEQAEALLALGHAMQSLENHPQAIEALGNAERLVKGAALPQGPDKVTGTASSSHLNAPNLHARILRRLGISYSVLGRHAQAIAMLSEAAIALGATDDAESAHARFSVLNARSRATDAMDDSQGARRIAFAALQLEWHAFATEMHARAFERLHAMAVGNAAIAARHSAPSQTALDLLQQAADLQSAAALRMHEAVTRSHMGAVLHTLGRYPEAVAAYQLSIERHAGGSPRELMEVHESLAESLEAVDDPRAALAAYKQARAFERQLHDDDARIATVRREDREEIARLTVRWQQLADEDPLTGLSNRRVFDRSLLALGESAELALLILDLDHFKDINDRFGHPIGDAVLTRVASALREGRRTSDISARLGGEEFALLLPQATLESARAIAEAIRARVQSIDWDTIAQGLRVTVSIGLAMSNEVDADDARPTRLVALADQRLYLAKGSGRNRVSG